MKRILIAVFVFISAATAFCDQRFDAVAWRDVQTYDVPTLNRIADLQIGKIVAVRFEFRSKRLLHIKPSWYEASLWQHNREEQGGFSYIRVYIAKDDVPAFESLPSDFKSTAPRTIYGQVKKDFDAHYIFVQLIGRWVTLHPDRSATVRW